MLGQEYQLLSSQDSSAISYAHVFNDKNIGTYSDGIGKFSIDGNFITISHINYGNTLINLNQFEGNVLYLKPVDILLDEINIVFNQEIQFELIKKPTSKFNTYYNYLNISSLEMSMVFKNQELVDYQLKNLHLPIKLGKDFPILKINIFDVSNEDKPLEQLASHVVKSLRSKSKQDIEIDVTNWNIALASGTSIAISVELIGYEVENNLSFNEYRNFKDALAIKMRKNHNLGFIRNKNHSLNWGAIKFPGEIPAEPAFELGLISLE